MSHIDENGKCPISYYDELDEDDRIIFNYLYKQHLIAYTDCEPDGQGGYHKCKSLILTEKGKIALLAENERLDAIDEQAAQEACEKTKDRTRLVFKAIISLVGAVFRGEYTQVFERVKSMFKT